MLILFLFIAIALYMGLYFAWDFFSGQLDRPTAWLASLNRMIFAPDELIFQLLRGLILIVIFYVIADFFIAAAKRGLKKKAPPEEMKLKSVTLPGDQKR